MQIESQKYDIKDSKISVTKLDAARRQLRTAIKLWFEDGDPVAIHTLVAAAYNVLHTLYRRKGLEDLIYDSFLIKDEHRKTWVDRVKSDANFFKHSDKDPDGEIIFHPFTNEFIILFCIVGLYRMGEPHDLEESGFVQWVFINRPEMLIDGAYNNIPINAIENLRTFNKREFFDIHRSQWSAATKR